MPTNWASPRLIWVCNLWGKQTAQVTNFPGRMVPSWGFVLNNGVGNRKRLTVRVKRRWQLWLPEDQPAAKLLWKSKQAGKQNLTASRGLLPSIALHLQTLCLHWSGVKFRRVVCVCHIVLGLMLTNYTLTSILTSRDVYDQWSRHESMSDTQLWRRTVTCWCKKRQKNKEGRVSGYLNRPGPNLDASATPTIVDPFDKKPQLTPFRCTILLP